MYNYDDQRTMTVWKNEGTNFNKTKQAISP